MYNNDVVNYNIMDVLSHFGVNGKYDKNILCPLHSESNPSFRIFRDNCWKCFSGCGTGNNITFVSKKLNLTNKEAAEYIKKNIISKSGDIIIPPVKKDMSKLILPEWYDDNNLDYLEFHKVSNINSRSIQNIYVSHKNKYNLWQSYKNVSKSIVDNYNLGVGYITAYDYLYNQLRLTVPIYHNKYPYPIGFTGRALKNSKLKWLALKNTRRVQQFTNRFSTDEIVILENYVDSFLIEDKFKISTVGLGGIYNYNSYDFINLLSERYSKFYILLDNSYIGNSYNHNKIKVAENLKKPKDKQEVITFHSEEIKKLLLNKNVLSKNIIIVDYKSDDYTLDPFYFIENNINFIKN